MYISDLLGLGLKGHANFDFADLFQGNDTKLFIDPLAIENCTCNWCESANLYIQSFFNSLFQALKTDAPSIVQLLAHAKEQNATKMGYGNGYNGKGKTADGLKKSLSDLKVLIKDIPTISRPEDLPVLVKRFDKDCMSDLLANILHDSLNMFTASQMNIYGKKSDCERTFSTWDIDTLSWIQVTRPSWSYNGRELLLVPKHIIRKHFMFSTEKYLQSVIVERIRESRNLQEKKRDIIDNLPKPNEHWRYDTVVRYTMKHPDALVEYHDLLPKKYNKGGSMDNEQLDEVIYRYPVY